MGLPNKNNGELSSGVKKDTKPVEDAHILDKVLTHVGDFGRYQMLLFLIMMPLGYTYAFVYFVQMFITATPKNYWCRVPELAGLSMELRRNLSAPGIARGDWDHCKTFDTNWSRILETLIPPPDGTPTIPCQYGWEFELSDIPYETVTSERDWVCNHASYVPTAQSVFFAGAVLGTFVFGWIADRFGRVPAVIATNLIGGIGGIATTFTSKEWDFILCRFIVGVSFDNCFMILYVLVLEYVGCQYRTVVANLALALSFAVAGISLPWIAYYIADWRILLWVTSLPMFLVLLMPWFLPESVKWLVSKGRVEEAVAILKRFESMNGKKIPDDVMDEFRMFGEKAKLEEKHSILEMLSSKELRWAMFSLILVFMGCGVVFDGLARLADSFGLSFFAVFSFNEVFEFAAIFFVIIILDRLGRRNSTTSSSFIASVLLLIALFVPEGLPQAILAILSRFFMTTCYTASMQWCTEVIPTPFRASGMSIFHMSAFTANIFSPFIVYASRVWDMLPMVIFTVISFITAGVCLTLPETKGLALPQTKEDGENIIREHSLCRKRKKTEDIKISTLEAS
ncbi:unnamed protein product [Arctia plantaginis]|uniref:Major facilitator superfamily (MFS) profile domain-containing protein n=1 Tax=Arctia plantaginis TaxID=874455 RepID=A0A8S1AGP1_ARCPL|nr:unnamed protein product [Arctia plantaginis]CAB3245462.1 unnamed protein product [Arctia plantaginis]